MDAGAQPLSGLLVAELAHQLPLAFAGRELVRLGARVVRIEPPDGETLRHTAPAWDAVLRQGKESVTCDLKREPELAVGICAQADVVLESFRPGVAARLGVGPDALPPSVVYCSITGFGSEGPHAQRAGHDLNYLGWAGALEDVPGCPPLPVADLAAGALGAVTEVLAALVHRGGTGEGSRITVSMTHRSHALVGFRLAGDPVPRVLTGGLASYGVYEAADGRRLTLAALEPRFFARVCAVLGRPDLVGRQYDAAQEPLAAELASAFAARPLAEWLRLFDGEDACVGPVATRSEAAAAFGLDGAAAADVPLGHDTAAWRRLAAPPS